MQGYPNYSFNAGQQYQQPKVVTPTINYPQYQQKQQQQPIYPSSNKYQIPNQQANVARVNEQTKRVSFTSNESQSRISPEQVYKQVERHLNASNDRYEYDVQPIEPNRVRTSEKLDVEKLNELKRVLNYYPHLIKEAKVVDRNSLHRNGEDEIEIAYHDSKINENYASPQVQMYKLSDLIMRSKSSSQENLNNKATQYENGSSLNEQCGSCAHSQTHETETTKSEETNREALDIFRKVDELVRSANEQSASQQADIVELNLSEHAVLGKKNEWI